MLLIFFNKLIFHTAIGGGKAHLFIWYVQLRRKGFNIFDNIVVVIFMTVAVGSDLYQRIAVQNGKLFPSQTTGLTDGAGFDVECGAES